MTAVASCGGESPATDFCSSYGDAVHELLVSARSYDHDPGGFSSTLESTLDRLDQIRTKAPDDRLRSAFDTASFTFTVFSDSAGFADFLTRADFSANAVVVACADYGVEVSV